MSISEKPYLSLATQVALRESATGNISPLARRVYQEVRSEEDPKWTRTLTDAQVDAGVQAMAIIFQATAKNT